MKIFDQVVETSDPQSRATAEYWACPYVSGDMPQEFPLSRKTPASLGALVSRPRQSDDTVSSYPQTSSLELPGDGSMDPPISPLSEVLSLEFICRSFGLLCVACPTPSCTAASVLHYVYTTGVRPFGVTPLLRVLCGSYRTGAAGRSILVPDYRFVFRLTYQWARWCPPS